MTNELPPELIASRGTTPNGDRRGSLVGDLVRRLSSTSDGEVVNTARALGRELNAAGVGFHELARLLADRAGHALEPAGPWNR